MAKPQTATRKRKATPKPLTMEHLSEADLQRMVNAHMQQFQVIMEYAEFLRCGGRPS